VDDVAFKDVTEQEESKRLLSNITECTEESSSDHASSLEMGRLNSK